MREFKRIDKFSQFARIYKFSQCAQIDKFGLKILRKFVTKEILTEVVEC
nr:MAG TPA: hypothetical protein [Caudoviricetes sp.]